MKGNLIKKLVGVLLSVVILTYLFSKVAYADTPQIDLNSLEIIGETPSTTTNEIENNYVQNNTVSEVQNNTVANTSALPQTGSNTDIIFVLGITILIGTTVYVYKKTKII